MRHEVVDRLIATISESRLRPYGLGNDEPPEVVSRYLWNTALSEALYPLLQTFEVALRNHVHERMFVDSNDPDWLTSGANPSRLGQRQRDRIELAIEQLRRKGRVVNSAALMGELTLGFWVSLFDSYDPLEQTWRRLLKRRAFPELDHERTRTHLLRTFGPINDLRNRVFHHEPIWRYSDLPSRHQAILDALHWICLVTSEFPRQLDRFRAVYGAGPQIFGAGLRDL